MKISITGDLGSGKTTVAKLLCKNLRSSYFSTGAIQRELASKLGIDTLSLNRISENDRKIDDMVDSALSELNNSENSIVIDARLGWFFIPSSFKVYLHVDNTVAAERVIKDNVRTSERYKDITSAKDELLARKMSENKRFLSLYNVDCSSLDNYDLIIDSSRATPTQISELIINKYHQWETHNLTNRLWFSPQALYPTHDIRQLGSEVAQNLTQSMQKAGFNESFPLDVIRSKGYFFIFDGHKRASAAIINNINLVPLNLIASNSDEIIPSISVLKYINNECSLSMLYDWEDCHKFIFTEYPQFS